MPGKNAKISHTLKARYLQRDERPPRNKDARNLPLPAVKGYIERRAAPVLYPRLSKASGKTVSSIHWSYYPPQATGSLPGKRPRQPEMLFPDPIVRHLHRLTLSRFHIHSM